MACADLIVLAKGDLLDAAGAAIGRGRGSRRISAGRSRSCRRRRGGSIPSALLGLGLAVEDDIENRRTHHDDELDHDHDEFDSFVVELPPVARPEELAVRVAAAVEAEDVLRLKGFADVAGKPMRLMVQAVGPRVSHHYDRRLGPGRGRVRRGWW